MYFSRSLIFSIKPIARNCIRLENTGAGIVKWLTDRGKKTGGERRGTRRKGESREQRAERYLQPLEANDQRSQQLRGHYRGPWSDFFNELRLQFHCPDTIYLAVDVVVSIRKPDIFYFSTNFHHQRRAFHF